MGSAAASASEVLWGGVGQGGLVHHGELHVSAHLDHAGVGDDGVADIEAPDTLTQGDDLAGQLAAGDTRQRRLEQQLELSRAAALVSMVDAGCDHAHQHLARAGIWLGISGAC